MGQKLILELDDRMIKIFSLERIRGVRVGAVVLLMCGVAVAPGQWSTSHTDPKVLATETGTAPLDVLAFQNGSVVATFSVKSNGNYQIRFPRFAADGTQTQPGTSTNLREVSRLDHLDLFPAEASAFRISTIQPRQTLSGTEANSPTGNVHTIGGNGYWESTLYSYTGARIAVGELGRSHLYYDHDNDSLRLTSSLNTVNLNNTIPSEAQVVQTVENPNYALACYTRSSRIPGIPSEIWIIATHDPVAPGTDDVTHVQLHSQIGVSQSRPQLTKFDDDQYMITWLGESGGSSNLYARLLTKTGQPAGGVFVMQPNVSSSKACSSHLGVPVHAFVQRSPDEDSPVDILWAGLIDPRNGVNLNLPMATGTGIEVKTLRQEENGDFSLVYSVVENNTTLLKTQRISGVTGMLMWEAVVADLGMASAEFIGRYPNTAVDGFNNVLYFVTRKDNPYNRKVAYHLTRLRADGLLGADPID